MAAIVLTMVATVIIVIFADDIFQPPNGIRIAGRLDEDSPVGRFGGHLRGPALFKMEAGARVHCSLTIAQTEVYHSSCRSFTYRYEFEESCDFSFELSNMTAMPADFAFTVAAAAGWETTDVVDGPPVLFSNVMEDLPVPISPVPSTRRPPIPIYRNVTLSFLIRSSELRLRVPESLDIMVNSSVSLNISHFLREVLIISGDDCRGATSVRVRQVVGVQLDITLIIRAVEVPLDPVEVELQVLGPDLSIISGP